MNAFTNEATNGAANDSANVNKDLLPIEKDKTKISAIHKALGGGKVATQRAVFPDLDTALNAIKIASDATESFYGLPLLISAVLEDENADWSKHDIIVSTVTQRESGINTLRAIVVFPLPKVEYFIEETPDFVAKLIQRESADVAFTGIRKAYESDSIHQMQQALDGIGLSTTDLAQVQREGADLEAFNDMWTDFRAAFVKKRPAFADAIPTRKFECVKAMRSKSYALANPYTSALEGVTGKDGDSGWATILKQFIKAAGNAVDPKTGEPKNYDLSAYESWLEKRDTFVMEYQQPKAIDTDTLSFD